MYNLLSHPSRSFLPFLKPSSRSFSFKSITNDTDFNTTLESNKSTNKLIIIDWYATWCGPCHRISPIFEKLSNETKNQAAVFMKVDVDQCEESAQRHEISSMPTFQFFKNGKKIDEFSGADPNKLSSLIEKHL